MSGDTLAVDLVVGELVSVEAPALDCAVAIDALLMTSAVVTITRAHRCISSHTHTST